MIRSMLILVSLNEEQTYYSCFALVENGPDNKQIKYLLMGLHSDTGLLSQLKV